MMTVETPVAPTRLGESTALNDTRGYGLAIAYVIALTASLPVFLLCTWGISRITDADSASNSTTALVVVGAALFIALSILSIMNIARSFKDAHRERPQHCVATLLILKYGLVPFFILNFLFWLAVILFDVFFSMFPGAAIATIPFLFALVPAAFVFSFLALLPGAFYGVQVANLTAQAGKTTAGGAVLHSILQFVFLADVIDAMFLALRKWEMGKKSSIAVIVAYAACIAYVIYLAVTVSTRLSGA